MSQRVITGNSWRIGPDDGNWVNIVRNIDIDSGLAEFAGPCAARSLLVLQPFPSLTALSAGATGTTRAC